MPSSQPLATNKTLRHSNVLCSGHPVNHSVLGPSSSELYKLGQEREPNETLYPRSYGSVIDGGNWVRDHHRHTASDSHMYESGDSSRSSTASTANATQCPEASRASGTTFFESDDSAKHATPYSTDATQCPQASRAGGATFCESDDSAKHATPYSTDATQCPEASRADSPTRVVKSTMVVRVWCKERSRIVRAAQTE